MELSLDAEQLRKALADIERAEKNGFMYCRAIFKIGYGIPEAKYSDLWEKAHPTSGAFDWGRMQRVSVRHKFKNGKLIPIRGAKP